MGKMKIDTPTLLNLLAKVKEKKKGGKQHRKERYLLWWSQYDDLKAVAKV